MMSLFNRKLKEFNKKTNDKREPVEYLVHMNSFTEMINEDNDIYASISHYETETFNENLRWKNERVSSIMQWEHQEKKFFQVELFWGCNLIDGISTWRESEVRQFLEKAYQIYADKNRSEYEE